MPPAVAAPPPTQVEPITETLHGIEVTDPYRWLEDQNSPRTRAWIEEQTAYTRAYLDAIPGRERIRERVRELLALKQVISEPWNVGERYFFLKHHERKEQPVIVMRSGLFGNDTVLVDPALRGTGPSTAVAIAGISEDGRFLAFSVRQGGTDYSALEIVDLEQNVVLPDKLPEGLCTGFAFAPDGSGFYYSHREIHDPHPHYRAVVWHGLGTDRSRDREVFFAGEQPNLFVGVLCSPEANLLAFPVFSSGKLPRTSIYLRKIPHSSDHPKPLLQNIEGCFVPFFVHGQLFAYTDCAAPNFRVVHIDVVSPDPARWRDVVPETSRRIQQFAVAGDQIFITRIERFATSVEVFRLNAGGNAKGEIAFSTFGSIDLLNSTMNSEKVFYSQTSLHQPPSIRCYDTRQKKLSTCDETDLPPDERDIEVEECAYPSRDETIVPLLVAARKDLLHLRPLPTFLSGYGGFGTCVTPRFTAFATFLMEQGFLFAVPALRGGSELGEEWHRAGMRENRQNAFDDFIAAAEWLIAEGRATPGRIAIGGGSNAGLLAGAAITQRPDLFCAAICLGPLLDMARYHLFDFGAGWADEYGSPDDEQDFHSLLSYSPYHHIQDGAEYPAVLLISGDADTRCNPMHARKMVARLQAANASNRPILLDYKPAWGHTPVQPLSTKIEALTNRLAFVCHELGVRVPRGRFL
jgi:prolyl oligopeptidase